MVRLSARSGVAISRILQQAADRRKCFPRSACRVSYNCDAFSVHFGFPTLSVWSYIQARGLEHRLEASMRRPETKNQKTKIWERIFWFRLDFWFFWFYTVFFGFCVKKPKNPMCFFGFHGVTSLKNQQNQCFFWFLSGKPKKTCVLLVFAVSRSQNLAKTLANFGFSFKNQKNTWFCWFFSDATP